MSWNCQWNDHHRLAGSHAFLSASQHSWLNYDSEKLQTVFLNSLAKKRGTRLHALAAELIALEKKLSKNGETLSLYVNDAIKYKMTPEQILYYSDNCYGTADAICFRNNVLRIHDLKTGNTPARMEQLMIYAALFCLEYNQNPQKIQIKLRIYQNDTFTKLEPTSEQIETIMEKIRYFDTILTELQIEEV